MARDLGLGLDDVSYSGATTEDILRPSARGQPAQLDAVTRLVLAALARSSGEPA